VIARWSPAAEKNPEETLKSLIDEGLRARLESASLVTGQQVVQLNFFPGTPIKLEQTDLPYQQIPTVPSPTQQIMSSVDAAAKDLPTLIKEATGVLQRVQQFLSPENETAINSILESAASAMKSLQADAASLNQVIDEADKTLASAGQLSNHLDGVVQDNSEDIRATVRNFRAATVTVNRLMDQLNQIVATNRLPIRQFTEGSLPDLTALIIDARTTVNKAAAVLDSLERNPTRFIFGNRMGQGVELK
jgi:phospholipid/cholesterol/gamma-HCH transport system substrate-binding protein